MRVVPTDMPLPLVECPPGLFVFGGADPPTLGFKIEHGCYNPHDMEVYVVETGEAFTGGTDNRIALAALLVFPAGLEGNE